MSDTEERELKLVPDDEALLDTLASVELLGPFVARRRRRERQRNAFFDSASRALSRARVGFRRRTVEGQTLAAWTIKGGTSLRDGVTTRAEIELHLDVDTPPALALNTLRAAARSRGARALAEAIDDALAAGGLPRAEPFLETETDRHIVDLEAPEHGWQVELALDRMHIVGHDYREAEIEAELKRGDDDALAAAREAITALGRIAPSRGSKLSRANAHVAECHCARAEP